MNKIARQLMHGITVIPRDATITEAAKLMAEKNIGSVMIGNGNDIEGILTERDIIKKIIAKELSSKQVQVHEIMSHPLETINAESDIFEVAQVFREKNIRRLPVEDEGKIIGILTTRDVTRALIPDFYRDNPLFKDIKEYKKKG